MFVVQHELLDAAGRRTEIGRFRSFIEVQEVLDQRFLRAAWQGIHDDVTGDEWWRHAPVSTWQHCSPA